MRTNMASLSHIRNLIKYNILNVCRISPKQNMMIWDSQLIDANSNLYQFSLIWIVNEFRF